MSKAKEVTRLMTEVLGFDLPTDLLQVKTGTNVVFRGGMHDGMVGYIANVHTERGTVDVFLGRKLVVDVKPEEILQCEDTGSRLGDPSRPEANLGVK